MFHKLKFWLTIRFVDVLERWETARRAPAHC